MAQRSCSVLIILTIALRVAALPLRQVPDPCACKSWKKTYEDNGVTCGAGNELYFMIGNSAPEWDVIEETKNKPVAESFNMINKTQGQMFCTDMYERLDFNMCLNINIGKDEGTWCYVDKECDDLRHGGGRVSNTNVSWKICKQDDMHLRDIKPEALYKFSKKNDFAFAVLDKLAYPGHSGGERIFLTHTYDFENGTVPVNVGTLINTSVPTFFDTHTDGHMPQVILYDGKAYRVDTALEAKDDAHPGTWAKLSCMMGCPSIKVD